MLILFNSGSIDVSNSREVLKGLFLPHGVECGVSKRSSSQTKRSNHIGRQFQKRNGIDLHATSTGSEPREPYDIDATALRGRRNRQRCVQSCCWPDLSSATTVQDRHLQKLTDPGKHWGWTHLPAAIVKEGSDIASEWRRSRPRVADQISGQ